LVQEGCDLAFTLIDPPTDKQEARNSKTPQIEVLEEAAADLALCLEALDWFGLLYGTGPIPGLFR
jgi:hypothetical protein